MERRQFVREKINVLGLFYIQDTEPSKSEFAGMIFDVCEMGISIKVTDSKYFPIVDTIDTGTIIKFYFCDEHFYFKELKRHEIVGDATVVWKERTDDSISLGCRTLKMYSALDTYVSEKKTLSFIERGCKL